MSYFMHGGTSVTLNGSCQSILQMPTRVVHSWVHYIVCKNALSIGSCNIDSPSSKTIVKDIVVDACIGGHAHVSVRLKSIRADLADSVSQALPALALQYRACINNDVAIATS